MDVAEDIWELVGTWGIITGGSRREKPRRLHEECADPFHPQLDLSLLQVPPKLAGGARPTSRLPQVGCQGEPRVP